MRNSGVNLFDKAIAFCFYLIFFFVPLAMHPNTYELFEFNKMWVVFILTIIIGFLWLSKMIMAGKIFFRKTPLDIFILLFLLSQFLSTIFSIDPYVSIWGYYSRFNGGLLSSTAYIFLYYAFASNLTKYTKDEPHEKHENGFRGFFENTLEKNGKPISYKLLLASIFSGIIVALWGLPSHFGYDPTCFVFRGTFDVSCWTFSFQPKVRMFSTLGQPNWLAAYLAVIISFALSLIILFSGKIKKIEKNRKNKNIQLFKFHGMILPFILFCLLQLFYIEVIYTDSQSGFLGLAFALIVFINLYLLFRFKVQNFKIKNIILFFAGQIFFGAVLIIDIFLYSSNHFQLIIVFFSLLLASVLFFLRKQLLSVLKQDKSIQIISLILVIFFISAFFIGHPIRSIRSFTTFQEVKTKLLSSTNKSIVPSIPANNNKTEKENPQRNDNGITDSGKIRNIVWKGAFGLFKRYPLLGSGVETFAYSYYETRPKEHNLTSEWDFIYNKAHNEYLNYLATTGSFGLFSYILLIAAFLLTAVRLILKQKDFPQRAILGIGLIAGYVSILFSNFFGFSVVTLNLYLFIIPVLFLDIVDPENGIKPLSFLQKSETKQNAEGNENSKPIKILLVIFLAMIALYLEISLFRFWTADTHFALGYNLNRVGEYTQAYKPLLEAYNLRPEEGLYQDELSSNLATLSLLARQQEEIARADSFEKEAIRLSNEAVSNHPKNVIYYKTRTRVFYLLSQYNKKYLKEAINTLEKANRLAPTDAKILYNMGLLYEEEGSEDKAIEAFEKSIEARPIYRDARFAFATYLSQLAEKENLYAKKMEYKQKAKEQLEYILNNLFQNDEEAKKMLETID